MKKTRTTPPWRLIALAVVLAGALTWYFVQPDLYKGGPRQPIDVVYGEMREPQLNRSTPAAAGVPAPHGIARDIWQPPPSGWLLRERDQAARSLGPTNMLILPVQGDKNAFDPIERSLITRVISRGVAHDTKHKVSNPSVVLRYLGRHRTEYPDSEIAALAQASRADQVLILRAEHDRNGAWRLDAEIRDEHLQEVFATRSWEDLPYSPESPPFIAVVGLLDEIARFASGDGSRLSDGRANFRPGDFIFPETFEELESIASKTPLHSAVYLQFLGMLHPIGEFNEPRVDLFERSLVELLSVSDSSDYARYFKARALAYLDRRPAALAVLGEPTNRYETALLRALNGDLPGLREVIRNSGTSPLDFMAFRDLQFIEYWYDDKTTSEFAPTFVDGDGPWVPFIARAFSDYDRWSGSSAATVKLGLEELAPVEGLSLEQQVSGSMVAGDFPEEIDIIRAVWRHADELSTDSQRRELADHENHGRPTPFDLAQLARTITVADHIRRIENELRTRALPDDALEEISRFGTLFSGHPEIMLLEGEALQELADKAEGSEKESLTRSSAVAQLNGFSWTGIITPNAAKVARNYAGLLRQAAVAAPGYGSGLEQYSRRFFEYPRGTRWILGMSGRESPTDPYSECIEYTWTGFFCVARSIELEARKSPSPNEVRRSRLSEYSHRFIGNRNRTAYELKLAELESGQMALLNSLQEQVDAGTADAKVYETLGFLHKTEGDYEAAQATWLAYLQLDKEQDAISISHFADFGAAMLYWIGQYELAVPLLEAASGTRTGSGSAMSSAVRLAIIKGDFDEAIDASAHRLRRYNSPYAARDLMELLHITGQGDAAWTLFDQALDALGGPHIWSGALVGHRAMGSSLESITNWVNQSDKRREAMTEASRGSPAIHLAPRLLLMAGLMDRVPGEDLARIVADAYFVPRPGYRFSRGWDATAGENVDVARVTGPKISEDHDMYLPEPMNERLLENGSTVDYKYEMLAEAMTAYLNGEYRLAAERFNRMSYFYDLDEYLPYFALCSAEAGVTENIRKTLEIEDRHEEKRLEGASIHYRPLGRRFDGNLTDAVYAGFEGRHEDAMALLQKALNDRPYLGNRSIYPMYQVVDVSEHLFERTGKTEYRDFALEVSRRHTVVLPMYAWAHWFVAKHSDSEVEKVSSAASGLALDPLSHRATEVDDDILSKARDLLDGSGPPYLRRETDNAGTST